MKKLMLNTKNELIKLVINKKYTVLTIIGALISLVFIGSRVLMARLSKGTIVLKSNIALSMLSVVANVLVPLLVFMAVTDLFASEWHNGTIKASLTRPLTRLKLMCSKCLAVFALCCGIMLIMLAVSIAFQLLWGSGTRNMYEAIAAYFIDMLPILPLIALAVLINILCKSPTLSMLMCIVVYIGFKGLNFYVSPLGQMVFTSLSQWHRLWLGSIMPMGAVLSKIGILLGSMLILFVAAYMIFEKQDY